VIALSVVKQLVVCQSQSHVTTDGQSVGLSWCRAPSGAHDQIFLLLESYSSVLMGRPLWRESGSVICQYVKLFVSIYTVVTNSTCTRPLSVQAQYNRLCPIYSSYHRSLKVAVQGPALWPTLIHTYIHSYRYYGSLVTWTVVCLTAAKFKRLIFPVSGFSLSNVANISLSWFSMTSACCLNNFVMYNHTRTGVWKPNAFREPVCALENCQWCGEPLPFKCKVVSWRNKSPRHDDVWSTLRIAVRILRH
jgi:hypothetical protein